MKTLKKKIVPALVIGMLFVLLLGAVPASAFEPYLTYTYSSTGTMMDSPSAYSAEVYVDSAYMRKNASCQGFADIAEPTDLFAGPDGRVYIADRKNNQIVVLNKYYKCEAVLSVFDSTARDGDSFNGPEGVFVNEKYIYVCDTNNSRIVKFDATDYSFVRIISQPTSQLISEDAIFLPIAMVIDQYNRMFVISSTNEEGVIVMDENSNFTGYIGAPKVTYSVFDMLWRQFQTAEQRAASKPYIPTQFQNIAIDDEGFVYVTTSTMDPSKQLASLTVSTSSKNYAPVRKLNPQGTEIMKRNGFYDCGGAWVMLPADVSKIVDVAVGPEKSWSIIDSKRSRVFTYDSEGMLLFAFGDSGSQLGNITTIEAITYQGDNMLLLDYTTGAFTVFQRTSYGNKLIAALKNDNDRKYDQSIIHWKDVLQYNNNFDAAYIGVGKSLYRSGEYNEALEYLKAAYDTKTYSKAYGELRKAWVSKFVLLVPVVVGLLIFAIIKLFKYAAKVNKAAVYKQGRRTYWEELMFSFHLVFHPLDGFWDLKHEHRGSVRGATTILGLTILAFYYQSIGRGYMTNPQGFYTSLFVQILSVALPVLLFSISNWCLTTLFNGEGSFKDVYMTVCYALSPIPPVLLLTTIASNFVTETGVGLITFFNVLGFVWAGLLLISGVMVTHDYSFGKNIATLLGTIVSMVVIMFAAVLFTSLVGKMVNFISTIVTEISYRV